MIVPVRKKYKVVTEKNVPMKAREHHRRRRGI
jgi:hypothetical protein